MSIIDRNGEDFFLSLPTGVCLTDHPSLFTSTYHYIVHELNSSVGVVDILFIAVLLYAKTKGEKPQKANLRDFLRFLFTVFSCNRGELF